MCWTKMIVWSPVLHSSLADLVSCVPTGQGRSGKEINFHEILFCCIVKACIGNKYVVVPKLCSIKPLLESFSQFSPPGSPLPLYPFHTHIFIGPESDHWLCLSLTPSLTHWLLLVNLIYVSLTCEDGNSKLVEVYSATYSIQFLKVVKSFSRLESHS